MPATLIIKANGSVRTVSLAEIQITPQSVDQLTYGPEEIAGYQRDGMDLLIQLETGQVIRVANFFSASDEGVPNDLVLQDENGTLWLGQHSQGVADFQFAEIQSVDQLVG